MESHQSGEWILSSQEKGLFFKSTVAEKKGKCRDIADSIWGHDKCVRASVCCVLTCMCQYAGVCKCVCTPVTG